MECELNWTQSCLKQGVSLGVWNAGRAWVGDTTPASLLDNNASVRQHVHLRRKSGSASSRVGRACEGAGSVGDPHHNTRILGGDVHVIHGEATTCAAAAAQRKGRHQYAQPHARRQRHEHQSPCCAPKACTHPGQHVVLQPPKHCLAPHHSTTAGSPMHGRNCRIQTVLELLTSSIPTLVML